MWFYQSPIGPMCIYKNQNNKYSLQINEVVYGFYNSAAMAADDVFAQYTGCSDWDDFDFTDIPTDIKEWEYQS